jgi:excisionase family DNA binding protein
MIKDINTPKRCGQEVVQFTVSEAAEIINVSTKTIYRLIERRKLRTCKLLRKKMIPRKDVLNFAEHYSG